MDDLRRRWSDIARAALGQGHAVLAAALTEAQPLTLVGETLTISAPPNRSATFGDPVHLRALTQVLLATVGRPLQISLVTAVGTERGDRYRAAEEHPLVREFRQKLDADIVARELVDEATWRERLALREQQPARQQQPAREPRA